MLPRARLLPSSVYGGRCPKGGWRRTHTPKWWRPRQPHPGTRIIRYRCFLPDLAEFANYRRGGTDGATMDVGSWSPARAEAVALFNQLAERAGFEPAIRG